MCGRAIGRLKLLDAVGIKENIALVRDLDYAKKSIRMSVGSEAQIGRLGACEKEPETVAWIEASLRPGDVFYDVGANVGAYSFIADVVARGQAKIYAIEPSCSTYAALVENISLNACADRITALQVALSDQTKLLTFHHASKAAGASRHGLGQAVNEHGKRFEAELVQPILAYRLDELVRAFSLPPPDLMKIDVDGGELGVLTGGGALLARRELRSVLIEIDERIPTSRDVVAAIERAGLALASRHPRRGTGVFNYIFQR